MPTVVFHQFHEHSNWSQYALSTNIDRPSRTIDEDPKLQQVFVVEVPSALAFKRTTVPTVDEHLMSRSSL